MEVMKQDRARIQSRVQTDLDVAFFVTSKHSPQQDVEKCWGCTNRHGLKVRLQLLARRANRLLREHGPDPEIHCRQHKRVNQPDPQRQRQDPVKQYVFVSPWEWGESKQDTQRKIDNFGRRNRGRDQMGGSR